MILFRGLLWSYQTISNSAKKDTSPEGQQLLGGETETTTIQKQTFDLVVSEPLIEEKQLEKTTDGIPAEFIRNDLFERVFQVIQNQVLVETGSRSITAFPLYSGTIGSSVSYLFRAGHTIPTLATYFANYYYHTWDSITFIIETLAQPMDFGPVAFIVLPFTPKFTIPLNADNTNSAQYDWWSLMSSEHCVILDMCEQSLVEITVTPPKTYEWFTSDPTNTASFPTDPVYALPVLYCLGFGTSGNVAKTSSTFAYNVYAKFNGLRFAAPLTISNTTATREFQACSHWACATSPIFATIGYNHVGPCHGDMVSTPINNLDNNALSHDICFHHARSPSQYQRCDRQLVQDNVRDFKVMGTGERLYAGLANVAISAQMGYRSLFEDLTQDGDVEANPGPPKMENQIASQERFNINPYPSDFAMRRNGTAMNVCALDDDCDVSYEQFGDPERNHSWKSFIQRPGMFTFGSWSNGTTYKLPMTMGALWQAAGSGRNGLVPVVYASSFYRWWRGSFKVMIYFFGNAFVTARFRIVLAWGGNSGSEGSRFFVGFPTQDITVKGFVQHAVTVPYIYPTDWQPVEDATAGVQGDGTFPQLFITCIQIINGVSTTVAPSIPIVLFLAAGDDFKFKEPIMTMASSVIYPKESSDEFEACSGVRPFEDFKREFPPMPGVGGSTSEVHHATQVPDMEDQLMRWSNYETFAGDVGGTRFEFGTEMPPPFVGTTLGSIIYTNAAQMISSLFYYAGGDQDFSMNLRSVPPEQTGAEAPGYTGPSAGDMLYVSYGYGTSDGNYQYDPDPSVPDNGAYYMMLQQWTNVRLTIPVKAQIPVLPTAWFNQANFRPGTAGGDPILDSRQISLVSKIETYGTGAPTSSIDSVWFRAGPNFRLMRYLPLPSLIWWTNQLLLLPPAQHAQKVLTAQLERTMARALPYKIRHRTLNSYIASRLKQIYIDDGKGKEKEKQKTKKELGRILRNLQERDERQDSRLHPPGLTQGL